MNNISFQGSTSLFFDSKAYDRARRITSGSYKHLASNNMCKMVNGKVFTRDVEADNLTVVLRNDKDGILRGVPIKEDFEEALEYIAKKVDELKETAKNKLTAWIIGGMDSAHDAINTPRTLNKIAEILCDRPDIDTSILVGTKTGEEKVVFHTLKDKLEITLDRKLEPNLSKTNEENLEKFFEIVELNNVDIL